MRTNCPHSQVGQIDCHPSSAHLPCASTHRCASILQTAAAPQSVHPRPVATRGWWCCQCPERPPHCFPSTARHLCSSKHTCSRSLQPPAPPPSTRPDLEALSSHCRCRHFHFQAGQLGSTPSTARPPCASARTCDGLLRQSAPHLSWCFALAVTARLYSLGLHYPAHRRN